MKDLRFEISDLRGQAYCPLLSTEYGVRETECQVFTIHYPVATPRVASSHSATSH